MSRFYSLEQAPLNLRSSARAIAAANNGLLFDIGDMSTLYQDAAGTTPVTAVGQPVGLVLDKSQGLMLGPELVVNGTFNSNLSGWTAPSGGWSWDITGKARITGDGTGQTLLLSPYPLTAGKFYKLTADFDILGGSLGVYTGSDILIASGSQGKITAYFYAAASNFYFKRTAGTLTGTIDNISVRELYGNHATQSVTASRPVLSARKNVLLATETLATQSVTSIAAQYTLSFTGTGSVTLSGTATGTLTGTGVNDRVSLTVTPTAGTLTLTVSGSVTKAQLELGASAGPYQRVNTATDYDTDPRYFPKYLRFDGVDDYYNLPYMGLYANGSASVVAGVYLQPKATTQYIIGETTSAVTNSRYAPLAIIVTTPKLLTTLIRSDSGAEFINITNISDTLQPLPSVTSVVDTGNNVSMRTKGMLVSTANYSRASTLTANITSIGALAQSTAQFFAQMNLYSLIITKSAITDAQRIKCERYAASKAGVIL